MKFENSEHSETIRLAKTAMIAAKLGRDRTLKIRSDWEEVKISIMETAICAKMNQHPVFKSILLSTGNCMLIERTANDSFWGDGGNGKGLNMLGIILMKIRNSQPEYNEEYYIPPWIMFPNYPVSDAFWRHGSGCLYMDCFRKWLKIMQHEAREEYLSYYESQDEFKAWISDEEKLDIIL